MVAVSHENLATVEACYGIIGATHLTCSLYKLVSPNSASACHLPTKSSPRKGLSGFFSLPSFSLRLQYCWCRVVRNHLRTRRARFSGSASLAGATKTAGCSAQYAEYSVSEVEDKIKGGAVSEERSPVKEAIDWGNCQSMFPKIGLVLLVVNTIP